MRGRARRGLTLPELVVGLTILAILGAAMVRLIVSETRNVDRLMLRRSARAVTRSSVNLLLSELRMVVPEGGIFAASPGSIDLFVPYALGLSCGSAANTTTISLLPADSAILAGALYNGYAWRRVDGTFAFVDTALAFHSAGSSARCTTARITTLSGGRIVDVSPALPATAANGTPVFLVQRLRYWFGPSSDIPGAIALLRTRPSDGVTEELASPFDSTSRFRFFRVGADTAESSPPVFLDDLRGIEVSLVGLSTRRRFGATRPEQAVQKSSVFFTNAIAR